MMDTIIVVAVIAVAAGYIGWHFYKKGSSGGCGCGSECGGCKSATDLSKKSNTTGCNCSSQQK